MKHRDLIRFSIIFEDGSEEVQNPDHV